MKRRSLVPARPYLIQSVERPPRGNTGHRKPALPGVTDEVSMLHALDICQTALVRAGADTQTNAMCARCLELMPEPSKDASGVPVTPTAPPGATDR